MIEDSLVQKDVQHFIKTHTEQNITALALQKNPFPELSWNAILNQIAARQKAKDKLPTWYAASEILFPSKISIEQTSSEQTAAYKSTLISGTKIIDLTGGFGVDAFYFSKVFSEVLHCEMNVALSAIVKHNFEKLKRPSVRFLEGDSATILNSLNTKFDWIYVDPSRRNNSKGKVFMLKDCLPNVPDLLDFYFQYSDSILMKTAPLLDLTAGFSELKNVKIIHIVALENDVKELLWELSKNYNGTVTVKTTNIKKDKNEVFDFEWNQFKGNINYGLPKKYLYEPNSAIMKSGGFNEISHHFQLDKLHPHSQLYTADFILEFPGRIFEIQQVFPFQKKEMKAILEGTKANITTRNFPESVEELRKKWKIKEGGEQYCFFTTDANNHKIVLICTKI